jgi:hypothetical protein
MIVNNLYVGRPRSSVWPFKTDPPLVINTDAVLSLAISSQRFETIAGQEDKVSEGRSRFQPVEFQARRAFDSRKSFYPFPSGEVSGALISVADNHSLAYTPLCVTSSITTLAGVRDAHPAAGRDGL